MSDLYKEKDLTRWSRSGLDRLRYVDGNAVTFLETLRQAAREEFTEAGKLSWEELEIRHPELANETAAERQARWLAQYYDERRDHGWEILRAFSRAAHVLGEYVDTYANENLLRTCTEWDNLRRLVEMLDYHPSPPASAETTLAILAKTGMSGTLEAGFAVKNKPPDGSKPAIFETLADLEVSEELNELYAVDRELSQLPFVIDTGAMTAEFPLAEGAGRVSVGDLGVMLIERENADDIGLAVEVLAVTDETLTLAVEPPTVALGVIRRHQVRLLLEPGYKQATLLTGERVVELDPDHGIGQGAIIAWDRNGWKIARVEAVLGSRIRLSRSAPPAGTDLFTTAWSEPEEYDIDGSTEIRVVLPTHKNDERFYPAAWNQAFDGVDSHSHQREGSLYLYDYWTGNTHSRIYYVPDVDPLATVLNSAPADLSIQGKPGDFGTGDWLLLEDADAALFAARVDALSEGESTYSLLLSPTPADVTLLRGAFGTELRPLDHDRNHEPVFLTAAEFRSEYASVLPLELPEGSPLYPALLEAGRELCLEADGEALLVTVKGVDEANRRVTVSPAIPGSEPSATGTSTRFTRYDTRIYGNVVAAGHGESQARKVLGSGDATRSGQAFVLDVDDVSFVVDSAFPPGVRAALTVAVDGRIWQQVASLNDSSSEDHHYTVRVREDHTLLVQFGDGTRGRRLPSGNNNIQVSYRRGMGLAGNLDPLELVKSVKPHYLVDDQRQPLPATGGADRESAESLRENAPESVLTLERAVSLSDYKHLAATNSSVWQAEARMLPAGLARRQNIEIAVVPAGGGLLGSLETSLRDYLQAHSTPGVSVSLHAYYALILDLELVVSVDESAFDPDLVADAVRQAIFSSFSLERARLGAPLYRSQVFAVIEGVQGVENCQCTINPGGFVDESGAGAEPAQLATSPTGAIKRVTPFWDQLIYAHPDLSAIHITTEAFE